MIRRDLGTVRQLAAEVRGGLPAGRVVAGVRSLATGGPVVEQLEADHVRVAGLLDEVEAAAGDLGRQEDPVARQRLIAALEMLSTKLLAHLAYEEENVAGTMRTMTGWPGW